MTTMNYLLDGASSACQIDWNAICWTKVEKQVRRLQVRIAKAVREGRHGKAKRKHCSGLFLTRFQQNSLRLDE